MTDSSQSESKPKRSWFVPTPGKLVAALLLGELLFLLADRLSLFGLKRGSGWNVLVAVGIFLAALLVLFAWFGISLALRRRSRSNFQFTIITLFLLMGCVSVVGGWFGWKLERARRQGNVVREVESLGGRVVYDYHFRSRMCWVGEPSEPPWARRVFGGHFFHSVREIDFIGRDCPDLDLAELMRIEGIEQSGLICIHLQEVDIADDELQYLNTLENLRILALYGTGVTRAGVRALEEQLPKCRISVIDIADMPP